ncbi:histone-like nucleoid-structuring protein Lsr2 [Brevibacterium album]|uniref:histone-like nucleoid-structuring protein Lsr2 n=1 Tax=Brevibacterium album TaxID=417948 RepID=UPI00040EF85E|nr:Lsr2 family protein [Brevibacterium album]
MATKTLVISDISGEPDAETVTIGLRSNWYDVDLTASERTELEQMLTPYIQVGRKPVRKPSNRFVPETTPDEREEIRAWAKEQGYAVADYGMVPKKIYRAYTAAHA